MELVLKPIVRNKITALIQQQKLIEAQIYELVTVVAECEGIELNKSSIIKFSEDLKSLLIEDAITK